MISILKVFKATKIKYMFLLMLFFSNFIFSQINEQVSISILNKAVKSNDLIKIKIFNKTKSDLYLPYNPDLYEYSNHVEDQRLRILYFQYIILENDREINTISTRKSGCIDNMYSVNNNINYFNKVNFNNFLIKPKNFIEIELKFNDTIKFKKCDNIEYFEIDKKKNYFFQIEYFLGDKDLNKFFDKKFHLVIPKFYRKRIRSNKVPLLFD